MFKAQNKIVIIDDNENDLLTLARVFLKNGLTCKTIHYTPSYEKEKLTGVRIAFFDINLFSQGIDMTQGEYDYRKDPSLSATYNYLANAIEEIIAADNGPYILVFWTKNTQLKDNFLTYVTERRRDIPSPVSICCLDKAEVHHLEEKVMEIISGSSVHLLYDFEKKCTDAATRVIHDICSLIPRSAHLSWGDHDPLFEENFRKVFCKLAVSKTGRQYAETHTDNSIYQTLAPLLEHHLINSSTDNHWKAYLGEHLDTDYPSGFDVSKLNSIYHLDTQTEVTTQHRGAVFEYMPQTAEGANPIYYFKSLEEDANNIFSKFITFKEGINPETKAWLKTNSKYIMVEISASCDFCQNKARNFKYLLGMLTPVIDNPCFNYDRISEAILHKDLPIIHFEDTSWKLWIHLNYSFSSADGNHNFGNPLFILKKELMDMIGNRYANHVSRIGISSF